MCGIIGYIGQKKVLQILINGLLRLEYRGYDSCGVSFLYNDDLITVKTKGKVLELKEKLDLLTESTIGIAHTRWATHGIPSEVNSHPHTDFLNNISLVHNGIIENYESLKKFLQTKNITFRSDTDSEVLVGLISYFYKGDLKEAVLKAISQVVGTFGILVLSKNKREIVVARKGSPVVLGIGEDEYFIASDTSAIIEYTKDVIYLNDGEIALINDQGYYITDFNNEIIDKDIDTLSVTLDQIEKQGYKHFMLKEIYEQKDVIKNALAGRIDLKSNSVILGGLDFINSEYLEKLKRIVILACGTSWHCALVSKFIIEKYLKIPVEVDYASEFRYRDPLVDQDTLVIVISQSGETADTLAALREAKEKNAKTLGIVNVVGSTIAREVSCGIYTRAGPEIGVASTKAFTNQLISMWLFVLYVGQKNNLISIEDRLKIIKNLSSLPEIIFEEINNSVNNIKKMALNFKNSKNFLYLGRGINYPIALEGALKLKEISYIHAEGYPAAEMKHGPIALIDKDMPCVFIVNKNNNYEKVISNINEVKARGGVVISIATKGDVDILKISDYVIYVEDIDNDFTPFLNLVIMQLIAYFISDLKGCEIDKPRNLAKSVTVE
ncbi:MAG: glutamine--fructose-6-phosphate transaminase (isomerizing) [Candidatus ainarchaeum sp.]|nr:glutamine--fructose-6-phosphate transaminase (isomerizing) [Candidatus ainarchaeum sp.]